MIHSLVAATTVFLLSLHANAKEGFNAEKDLAPPGVQNAWESVFLLDWIRGTTAETATAFLVAAIPSKNATDLYFLTNAHAVPTNCEITKTCGQLHLIQNARFSVVPNVGRQFSVRDGLTLGRVEVSFADQNPDLALLHKRIPKDVAFPHPLPIANQCRLVPGQPLYTIGFSDPSLRTAEDRLPIVDAETTTKRWSEGVFLDYIGIKIDQLLHTVSGTTVDVLKGGSGAPLLTASGEVAGVIQIAATNESTGRRYAGVETPKEKRSVHAVAVPCDFLNLFIQSGIESQRIRAKIPRN